MELKKFKDSYLMRVTRKEALGLIKSLSGQLLSNNSNAERLESYCNDGDYFSIAVDFSDQRTKANHTVGYKNAIKEFFLPPSTKSALVVDENEGKSGS